MGEGGAPTSRRCQGVVDRDDEAWDVGFVRETLERPDLDKLECQRILIRNLQASGRPGRKGAVQRHPLQTLVPAWPGWNVGIEWPDGLGARVRLGRMVQGPHTDCPPGVLIC